MEREKKVRVFLLSPGAHVLLSALLFGLWLSWRPIKVYQAKVWSEEFVALMVRDRELLAEDNKHFGTLYKEMNWHPRAFFDGHSMGYTLLNDGVSFYFNTDAGSFFYNSVSDEWSEERGMLMSGSD